MKNPKPEHKFFERFLDNDIDSLYAYLVEKANDLASGKIEGIPSDALRKDNRLATLPTKLGQYYNIFKWENESVKKLKIALCDTIKEACEYYGIDFDSSDYMINGWFNLDLGTKYGNAPYDPKRTEGFHDHMDGKGAPVFHGYYCVNAEPSSTYYLINRETPFENINKNNRLVVSETGHPHTIGNWDWDGYRITIAYDISPKIENYIGPNWISLND